MYRLAYSCKCGWSSRMYVDAQQHANDTGHTLDVTGTLSASERPVADESALTISEALKKKVREAEILRRAKQRGLVK